ncbi:polyphosphate kinase 2 family protein [Rhizosaccharibacter radicis]|uniref:Polyphosphate kinase 2 family protein n=1 Tax=Rhizosaccharibacter radicis TaxID=2782605 RepID=A0ABT1VXX0_9PROT|nr:polyphosphate kinase 2 family protein [Acetobacteraceae bacterium KSS12]
MDHKRRRKLLARYRITHGKHFELKDHDPRDTDGIDIDKDEGKQLLAEGVERLAELQGLLYADGRHAVLAAFQAMDAGGKDGTIKHVMSGVNPQGVTVTSFKQPGPVEMAHDFLWRIHLNAPMRGRIGIFNRSHYEEVLVAKVHPAVLDNQNLPHADRDKKFWRHRYEDISNFELMLSRQGTTILKFFLHLSKDEQRERFLARIDEPDKNWKFSASDLKERGYWDAYQEAYEDAIRATATPHAPWFVIPADRKWYGRLLVVEAMIDALEGLDLKAPAPPDASVLADARRALEKED